MHYWLLHFFQNYIIEENDVEVLVFRMIPSRLTVFNMIFCCGLEQILILTNFIFILLAEMVLSLRSIINCLNFSSQH